ncbi:MAG: FAD-binding oxidoreductase [Pseudomonadota bacterium]
MKRIYDNHAYRPSPVGSYWEAVTPKDPVDPTLDGDRVADVAIIGAGYTGLSAALHLARDFGCKPVVLDAQEVGWGASGRNGGFNCMGGSKLGDRAYAAKFGQDDLARYYQAQVAATTLVGNLTQDWDVGRQEDGEWAFAHRAEDFEGFSDDAARLNALCGVTSEIVPKGALAERGLQIAHTHGAMRVDAGFPLNPRAYVQALARAARAEGAQIFANTPVTGILSDGGRLHVTTPAGKVTADRVILAANGYNSEDVPGWMGGRYLPVISHIMVTEPLGGGNWMGTRMAYDTRNMLHYFRRLPDDRMLFGMRGAPNDGPDARVWMKAMVKAHFADMFPDWADAAVDHHWAGLICMTRDLVPYVGAIEDLPGAYASLAYHGNGVSQATWCGRQVAGMAMGREYGGLPDGFRGPLKRFPLPGLRRHTLGPAFKWYAWKDR